jgi:hypothetical protein
MEPNIFAGCKSSRENYVFLLYFKIFKRTGSLDFLPSVVFIKFKTIPPRTLIRKSPTLDPAVSMTPGDRYVCDVYLFIISFCYGFPLKGMRANNCFREGAHCLIDTVGSDPAVSLRPWTPNFATDYLDFIGEYEAFSFSL